MSAVTLEMVLAELSRMNLETRDGFARLDSRMSGLETRMSRLEIRMDGFETRLDGVETRMSGLESKMNAGFQSVQNDLKIIREQTARTVEDVEDLKLRVTRLEGPSA